MSHAWTAAQEADLRYYAGEMSTADLAAKIGRTVTSVQRRASVLGISLAFTRPPFALWSPEEDAQLRELSGKLAPGEIAKQMGRSEESVRHRGMALGCPVGLLRTPRCRWRSDEIAALIEQGLSAPQIARQMELKVWNVRARTRKLGLKCKADGRGCPMRPPGWVAPRQPKPKPAPRHIVRVSVSALAYCGACHAPVINTPEGWAAHRERLRCAGRMAA